MNLYAQDLITRLHGRADAFRLGSANVEPTADLLDEAAGAISALLGHDPPCTDCGGTGITYQTERRCSCMP